MEKGKNAGLILDRSILNVAQVRIVSSLGYEKIVRKGESVQLPASNLSPQLSKAFFLKILKA